MNLVWALSLKILVVAAFAGIAVFVGSPVVGWTFRRVDAAAINDSAPHDDSDTKAPTIQAAAVQLRGGHWIGMLERLAIFASLLSGFAEGVAVVLAVKSLARYPELRATSSAAAERFIIGTFTSSLFAAACAGLAWWLIGLW
jgi:hypothetical protein